MVPDMVYKAFMIKNTDFFQPSVQVEALIAKLL